MDFSKETAELIERMCRNVERSDFILDKEKAEECLLKTYDLFDLERPKKVVWCVDIFDKEFIDGTSIAWSASSASSARIAWSDSSAWSARIAWSDSSAWSASSASSARSAWGASSTWSARSARSAWNASSASSALDFDFDYYIFSHEYYRSNKDYNDNDIKYLEYCELLMQAKEYGMGYRVEYDNTLYCVPTPLVKINSRNQFHSDVAPAIRWNGGKEFYFLNGVSFSEELWKKVVTKTATPKEILGIEDVDQRTQAMKYLPADEFFKATHAELIDESRKGNRLYKIPAGLFTIDAWYTYFKCPSTGNEYLHGIDPDFASNSKDADECVAWMFHLDKKTYQQLTPLVTES